MKLYSKERKELARYMRRLYQRGLTTASGGNLSLKIDDVFLITPSQIDKGTLKGRDIAVIDVDGKIIESLHKLSMETQMHLNLYKARPDINAIVHSHPTFATAFACTEQIVDTKITGEILYVCGIPKRAKYKLMGSDELADTVAKTAKDTNIIIMDNHGIVSIADSLFKAFDMIEVYENAARINYYKQMLGKFNYLPEDDQEIIIKMSKDI